MRLFRGGNHACARGAVVFALLCAAPTGCDKKESEAERLRRRMNDERLQSQRRLDEGLTELEAKLAKHEGALRGARDSKLPLAERYDLVLALMEDWNKDLDLISKQMDEMKAAVELGRQNSGWNTAHRDRLVAAMERLDRLHEGWDTVSKGLSSEVEKLKKAEPPKNSP